MGIGHRAGTWKGLTREVQTGDASEVETSPLWESAMPGGSTRLPAQDLCGTVRDAQDVRFAGARQVIVAESDDQFALDRQAQGALDGYATGGIRRHG